MPLMVAVVVVAVVEEEVVMVIMCLLLQQPSLQPSLYIVVPTNTAKSQFQLNKNN
jgi:hypothetical protein